MNSTSNSLPGTRTAPRREFLRASAGLVGSAMVAPLAPARSAHAAESDVIRAGLIGCGGRGTEAAINAMRAGPDVRIVALADIFDERLKASRDRLRSANAGQTDVKEAQCFLGFDSYRSLLACDLDVVLIAPCSHFIPAILKAAIEAGKHVFCEKPHGIDIPGLRVAMAACEQARQKKLSVVSGLCWRYDPGVRETMQRVSEGAIGDIVAIQENYLSSPYILRERRPGQSEMEYQMWNWYHFNWLSGDQTAQQLIHSLDKASWAMRDRPPRKVYGLGGRQTCLDSRFGDQFDHHAVVFEYDNGVRVIHRQGFGVHFFGNDGEIKVNRGQFEFWRDGKKIAGFANREDGGSLESTILRVKKDFLENAEIRLYESRDHIWNFMDCVRSRAKPITDEEIGGRSAICCHLLNQAYYNHEVIKWNPKQMCFAHDSGKPEWLTRDYRAPWNV